MVLHDLGHVTFKSRSRSSEPMGSLSATAPRCPRVVQRVVPDEFIAQWGADAFRTYLMFLAVEEGGDFRDAGISGVRRFLDRLWSSLTAATTQGARSGRDAQAASDDQEGHR